MQKKEIMTVTFTGMIIISIMVVLMTKFTCKRAKRMKLKEMSKEKVNLALLNKMVIVKQLNKKNSVRQFRCFNSSVMVTPSGKWVAVARYSNATHKNPAWTMVLNLRSHSLWTNFDPNSCTILDDWSLDRIISVHEGGKPWRYSGPEDLRMFCWKGSMWAVYNTGTRDNRKNQMYLCKLTVLEDDRRVISITADKSVMMRCDELSTHRSVQKNWLPIITKESSRADYPGEHMDFIHSVSGGRVSVLRCVPQTGVCVLLSRSQPTPGVGSIRKSLIVGRDVKTKTFLILGHRKEEGFFFQYSNIFYILDEETLSVKRVSTPFFLRGTEGTYRDFDYVMSAVVHNDQYGRKKLILSGGVSDSECFYVSLTVQEMSEKITSLINLETLPFLSSEQWDRYI